jgi:hypothetical protein
MAAGMVSSANAHTRQGAGPATDMCLASCGVPPVVASKGCHLTASSSAASFQQHATNTSCTDPPAAMVSCSELLGRPYSPLQARELGSNHDEPSTCHHSATSESTPAPTASPPGLSPQPGGRRSTRARPTWEAPLAPTAPHTIHLLSKLPFDPRHRQRDSAASMY